jgi:hypothetical protein
MIISRQKINALDVMTLGRFLLVALFNYLSLSHHGVYGDLLFFLLN